ATNKNIFIFLFQVSRGWSRTECEPLRRTRAHAGRARRYSLELQPTESRALSQDPDGKGRSNRSP
ncbi:unnamed protein product, partial [Ascophyllum nodosum]